MLLGETSVGCGKKTDCRSLLSTVKSPYPDTTARNPLQWLIALLRRSRNAPWFSSCLSVIKLSSFPSTTFHTTKVVPAFQAHYLFKYKDLSKSEWLGSRWSCRSLRYILSRYEKNPKHLRLICFGRRWTTCSWIKELKLLQSIGYQWVEVASSPIASPVPLYDAEEIGMPFIFLHLEFL